MMFRLPNGEMVDAPSEGAFKKFIQKQNDDVFTSVKDFLSLKEVDISLPTLRFIADSFSFHETESIIDAKQIKGGPGRGKYQYEMRIKDKEGASSAKVAVNRLVDIVNKSDKPLPPWLDRLNKDNNPNFSTLTGFQQDLLFFADFAKKKGTTARTKEITRAIANNKQQVLRDSLLPRLWSDFLHMGKHDELGFPLDKNNKPIAYRSSPELFILHFGMQEDVPQQKPLDIPKEQVSFNVGDSVTDPNGNIFKVMEVT